MGFRSVLTDEQRHAVFIAFLFVAYVAVNPEEPMVRVVRTGVAGVIAAVAIAWLVTR